MHGSQCGSHAMQAETGSTPAAPESLKESSYSSCAGHMRVMRIRQQSLCMTDLRMPVLSGKSLLLIWLFAAGVYTRAGASEDSHTCAG